MSGGQVPYTEGLVAEKLGKELCATLAARGTGSKWSINRFCKILHAQYLGLGLGESCAYAGLTTEAFRLWRQEYPKLDELLMEANPAGVMDLVKRLDDSPDELTHRWRLERRSKSFAPPVKQTEVRTASEPVKIELVMKDAQGSEIPVPREISGEEKPCEQAS